MKFNSIPVNVSVSSPVSNYGFHPFLDKKVEQPSASHQVYLEFFVSHCLKIFKEKEWAEKWLINRKIILPDEELEEFKVGFSDRSFGSHFSRKGGRASEVKRGGYQQLGIFKATTGFPFFNGHIVIPIFDIDGNIVGIYGRRITTENRKEDVYYHHWIGGRSSFFNVKALLKYKRVIWAKSPIEALTLISNGIPNVIATMGIQSFDEDHLQLLEKYKPNEVVIAFDNSDQGNIMAGLVAQALDSIDISCLRLPLPRNSDINTYACSQEDHKQALEDIMDCAFPFSQSYEMLATRR